MKSKVSVRGQTVIPKEIREALGITPETTLHWNLRNGYIVVHPVPKDPVAASVGILRGKGLSTQGFLEERRREREWELAKEKEQGL